jgi:hypothetical protein
MMRINKNEHENSIFATTAVANCKTLMMTVKKITIKGDKP